jgi:nicotinamidase-related amidase
MLQREDTVFVLIDVQGKLAQLMDEKDALFRNLEILIQAMKILDIPIIWLEQYPQGLGPTVPEIAAHLTGYETIAKVCFSACGEPEFTARLKASGRRQVLLAGIEAHICVYQTGRDLLQQEYHVEVVADAVSSRTQQNKRIGLDRLARQGAEITSVEMALFELLKIANTEDFRHIVKLVR